MAKLTLNAAFTSASGKLDTLVLRRAHNGQMTLIKLADMSKVKWSKAQKAHRLRFKQAVAYARAAMAEPTVRSHYEKEAAKLHKRSFDLAVSDYFKDRNLLAK